MSNNTPPYASSSPLKAIRGKVTLPQAALAASILAMGILLARKPEAVTLPQLWAEDGVIYLTGALRNGFWAIFQPYAGYGEVIPHTIAALLVPVVPLETIPLAFNMADLAVFGAIVFIISTSRTPIRYRAIYGILLAVIPHRGEIFFAIDNVQTLGAATLALLIVEPPAKTYWQTARDCAILLVFGLTGPYSLLLAPILAVRWFYIRPDRYTWPLVVLFAIVASLTLRASLADGSHDNGDTLGVLLEPENILRILNVAFHNWIGAMFVSSIWRPAALVAGALFVAYVAYCLADKRLKAANRLAIIGIILFGAANYFSMLLRINLDLFSKVAAYGVGERYTYVPYLMAAWVVFYFATNAVERTRKLAGYAILALFLINSLPMLRAGPGPDMHWQEQIKNVGHHPTVVQILPPGWKATVCRYPCDPKP